MCCCHLIGLSGVTITTEKTIRITLSPHGGQLCFFVVVNKNGGRSRLIRKKDGFSFNGGVVYSLFCGAVVHHFPRKVWISSGWLGWSAPKKLIFGKLIHVKSGSAWIDNFKLKFCNITWFPCA